MLNFDLAYLYGYKVKKFNQQVKKNIGRFLDDFLFQLPRDELKCQNCISLKNLMEIKMIEELYYMFLLNRVFICYLFFR